MDQDFDVVARRREPWNKGKLVGQKAPLRLKEIWTIRIRLQLAERVRELALFNLAVDSKLRSCDVVRLRVRDVTHGERMATRAIVMQQKTQRPVQFEITEQTRDALASWIRRSGLRPEDFLFPSRTGGSEMTATKRPYVAWSRLTLMFRNPLRQICHQINS
jgi:integrase